MERSRKRPIAESVDRRNCSDRTAAAGLRRATEQSRSPGIWKLMSLTSQLTPPSIVFDSSVGSFPTAPLRVLLFGLACRAAPMAARRIRIGAPALGMATGGGRMVKRVG